MRNFAGHDPARGSVQELFKNSRVESGRVRRCSKPHGSRLVGSVRAGSGQVGSARIEPGRIEPGRVGSGRVGSGRVGSGRVGSGRVTLIRSGQREVIRPLKNAA